MLGKNSGDLVGSLWHRFTDYQIKNINGRAYILPADTAVSESYIPRIRGVEESTFIDIEWRELYFLSENLDNEEKILEFCKRYGLLGIWPHMMEQCSYEPRLTRRQPDNRLHPTQLVDRWMNGAWVRKEEWLHSYYPEDTENPDSTLENKLLKHLPTPYIELLPERHIIHRRGPFNDELAVSKIDVLSEYFPNHPIEPDGGTIFPPMPATPIPTPAHNPTNRLFNEEYAEPLDVFKCCVNQFRSVVKGLAIRGDIAQMTNEQRGPIGKARLELAALNQTALPTYPLPNGKYHQKVSFKSLLAMFAYSLTDSLVSGDGKGTGIGFCVAEGCDRIIEPSVQKKFFCSKACQGRQQKRDEYRDLKRLEKEASANLGITNNNWKGEAEKRNLGHLSKRLFLRELVDAN